jgi:hypothetical protein
LFFSLIVREKADEEAVVVMVGKRGGGDEVVAV